MHSKTSISSKFHHLDTHKTPNSNPMTIRKYIAVFSIALLGSAIGSATVYRLLSDPNNTKNSTPSQASPLPTTFAAYPTDIMEHPNFVMAAAIATPAVVHIKAELSQKTGVGSQEFLFGNPFGDMFGDQFGRGNQRAEVSGSGVIITNDGFVVTNNHVVDGASKLEVVLDDKRSFRATVVGTDPSSDLALLKIEGTNLPFLIYGNSDEVKVGEWVLAVGNPFNLTSTVTAGIVSAKGRNINILQQDVKRGLPPVESFIQTDAAVNPGNSGGALVNIKGELIGINTAIASQTGSYAGYSFAIPSNLAKKIITDLMQYGVVQRAFLGIKPREVDATIMKEEGLQVNSGVLIDGFSEENSAAEQVGIQQGDVITKIDDNTIKSFPQLQEALTRRKPGDKVNVTINREGQSKTFVVTLRNIKGKTDLVGKNDLQAASGMAANLLGAEFEPLSKLDMQKYNLQGGVKIRAFTNAKLKNLGIKEGFIITSINREPIKNIDELNQALAEREGGILHEGIPFNSRPGTRNYYGFGLD